ncbi:hypothetical protein ACFVT6_26195 [Streptomyces sp. NPDC058049]|uniref:hypothetical protein n=1 Tax=Streptomyces sp. NPDC058049 TaxID=3346314 RepID=UPI0036E6CFB8
MARGVGRMGKAKVDVAGARQVSMRLNQVTSGPGGGQADPVVHQEANGISNSGDFMGKPVAIPVESGSSGYEHEKGPDGTNNWYLAVGSSMTNTTRVVTAVPGPDGKPQVSIDYQVNVWDRYNWDGNKATPIGPTTVTDADMARMHTTGLAREFDVRGSSSVRRHDLSAGGSWPAPEDTGRSGTRTDTGRNSAAR